MKIPKPIPALKIPPISSHELNNTVHINNISELDNIDFFMVE